MLGVSAAAKPDHGRVDWPCAREAIASHLSKHTFFVLDCPDAGTNMLSSAVPSPAERIFSMDKDDPMGTASQDYETPCVVDYGGLQELTASCVFGTGGDKRFPSGEQGGLTFGKEFVNSEIQCTSK